MQLRKPITLILLSCLVFFFFLSCKKNSDGPAAHIPKVKQVWAGNDVRTFTYDSKGRVIKIVYSLYGRHEYQYTDTGIVVNFYDTTNTWKIKEVYKLDSHGRMISKTNSNSVDINTYTYTADGMVQTFTTVRTIPGDPVRTWQTAYFYTKGNLDSVRRTYANGGAPTIQTDYYDEYYLDVPNTLGNDNYGQSYLGKSSKNMLKTARDIGTSGSVQPTTTYDYEFDELGRVIKQHHHWGTSNFTDVSYSYYD